MIAALLLLPILTLFLSIKYFLFGNNVLMELIHFTLKKPGDIYDDLFISTTVVDFTRKRVLSPYLKAL
jgi:hypothetical protein